MTEFAGHKLTERAEFLIDNLDLEKATGVEGARWENFQIDHLCDDSPFRIEVKSRQIAWSWLSAAEAVAYAILGADDTVFVSINQDEASEKVVYSRRIYESLKLSGLPKIKRDSLTDLEFDNGARLTSLTGRAPRGRARSHVRLDEFCFVQNDRQIYAATLPIIAKGRRTLRMASSPFGTQGLFYEIYSEVLRAYPGYTRKRTPWWEIYAFCTNVREARIEAPFMPTEERVRIYGNERIQMLYNNMLLEDFGQEFECDFVGSGDAWITFEEIKRAQDHDLVYRRAKCTGKNIANALTAIDRLADEIRLGRVEPILAGGIDVGRKKDTTEIFFVGMGSNAMTPLRLMISLSNMEFEFQQEIILYAMRSLPIVRILIDQTGLGRNLAENIVKVWQYKTAGVNFTQAGKQMWATDLKRVIQGLALRIPPLRDLAYQLHSIKRVVRGTMLTFDVEQDSKERGHGDMFWALALAVAAARQFVFIGDGNITGEGMVTYW